MAKTADQIMTKMGFPAADETPCVAELRGVMRNKVDNGLVDHSYGTWAGDFTNEQRAKAMLAMEWSHERGHSCRIECIDPPIRRTFNTKTMRRGIRISWHMLLPWVGDKWRLAGTRYRIWRDRHLVNPYN